MIKIGIVGFGKMGMLHGALLNGSGKAKVVAICDKSWVMRFGFKKVYKGVNTFKSVDRMLESQKLDAVIIATPTFNHVETAIKCAEKGCSLFIEKPLASNYEDAYKIYECAKMNNIKVQIGFCNRFAPTIIKGKEMLDSGIIGKVTTANAYMYIGDVFEKHSGWRYKKETSGGGVLMDFGIHMLDQIYNYFGEVLKVNAESKKLYSEEVEDELTSDILFENGVSLKLDTSWSKNEYRKSYARLEIKGENGKIEVTDQTVEVYDENNNRIHYYTNPDLYDGAFMDIGGLLYSKQIEEFLKLLEDGVESQNSLESSLYIQKLIKAIYKSAESKREIIMGGI